MDTFEEEEFTKNLDFALWKKIMGFALAYRSLFIKLNICNVTIALIDTSIPLMISYAIDRFIIMRDMATLPYFIAIYSFAMMLQVFNVYTFIYLAGKMETGIVYDVRKMGFKKLQELSFSYYDKTPVGWMMARMTTDAQKIGDVVAWGIIDLLWSFSYIIFVYIIMFIINWRLALISLAIIPALIITSIYFQKKILKGHREIRKINSKITGSFNEGINGAKTTKTLGREEENFKEFEILTAGMKVSSIKVSVFSSTYLPIVLSIGSIGVAMALTFGGYNVMGGIISVGTLSLFISYAVQIFEPIRQIANIFSEMQSAQSSGERTISLIEMEPDIVDRPDVIMKYGDAMNPKTENWEDIHGEIEFKNVSFSYKNSEDVLIDFNLHVSPGERIALVGETGSGKSTIVNLICRFYEPASGQILIDGKDYRDRSQVWLQSNLGYVLQSPHLFSGTIKENIRYGKLDATDEEVIEAAKKVDAYEFIMRFEKGFDTDVGEGGNKLSSGEKQLISFARAIIANPKIFILDEATSSIDTETEAVIQNAIEEVLYNRTSFIVAHRLSTIRSADRILVIKDGRIIESGAHKQLLKQKGYYYNLYTSQFKEEEETRLLNSKMPAENFVQAE